jgi:hypothetical protein
MAAVELVAHGSDPVGVTLIEFSVDGSVIGSVRGEPLDLLTARQPWTPPAPGVYTLTVRAQNRSGAWGGPAAAAFQVGEPVSAAPTHTPSPTASPTPSPTAAQLFVQVAANPKTFNHQNANMATCSPNQISFQVTVGDPQAVASVVLFISLSGDAGVTDWNEGESMAPLGEGSYAFSLHADAVPGAQNFAQATLRYQFVAFDAANAVLGRSPVYTDVAMGACP